MSYKNKVNRFIYLLLEALAGTFLDWNRNLDKYARSICKHTKTRPVLRETMAYEFTAMHECYDCGKDIRGELTLEEKKQLYIDIFDELDEDNQAYKDLIEKGGFNL